MRKLLVLLFIFIFCGTLISEDRIVTKARQEYRGRVVRVVKENYVIRLTNGSLIALPQSQISRIYRGNRLLDFEEGMSYIIQKKYPYLPFGVLTIASGAYAVNRYQEYERRKERFKEADTGEQDLRDNSGNALAESVIFGVVSLGALYVAFRPLEIKVPVGKINLSAVPGQVRLSLNF
ncbi:MAG TPA: hypothetical protein ENN17_08810 [bacterium]|nr:hypothetical protein [bacterium]